VAHLLGAFVYIGVAYYKAGRVNNHVVVCICQAKLLISPEIAKPPVYLCVGETMVGLMGEPWQKRLFFAN
jgi:hypothetical protein